MSSPPLLPVPAPRNHHPALRRALLAWYSTARRDLPWRRNPHPYRVWVSEIMLQQTRVAAVLGHYKRFLARFPSLSSLAAAREASVLAAWSGLGYYRRARMLHQAARRVSKRHNSRLPRTAAEWQELPGIGRYTANAIASICFGEPVAVVDGNVERVLTRLLGTPPQDPWQAAQSLLDPLHPGDFNQAMMELGATICTPKAPACGKCPIRRFCQQRGEHLTQARPARLRATLHYALATRRGAVLLVQRPAADSLMPNMWELPQLAEAPTEIAAPLFRLRHSITTTDYDIHIHAAPAHAASAPLPKGRWISLSRLRSKNASLPLTGLTRKALRRAALIVP